jgi:hypothetical protein
MDGKTVRNMYRDDLGLISNLMHKNLVYLHIIHLLNSSTFFEHYPAHLQQVHVVIVYMQPLVSSLCKSELSKITALLRRRPPEDEQGNTRNMQRSLINVLYVNKQEFCASSWRSNQGYTMMHGQPIIKM